MGNGMVTEDSALEAYPGARERLGAHLIALCYACSSPEVEDSSRVFLGGPLEDLGPEESNFRMAESKIGMGRCMLTTK
jgi:hypothetical protein